MSPRVSVTATPGDIGGWPDTVTSDEHGGGPGAGHPQGDADQGGGGRARALVSQPVQKLRVVPL